jgi:Putative rhamnosyl transferase
MNQAVFPSKTYNFEQFIITAFNVDFGLKSREEILSYEYLNQRFELFKQFCYPSVFHQINQNFKWLVFFDSETPQSFRDEIDILTEWKRFVPVYVPPVSDPGNFWREVVKSYLSPATEFLITSNLDNDDSLSKNFVELVQNNYQEQEFEFVNFPFGYMLRDDGLFLREFLSSPFISLIEKADNILTCKAINHNDLFILYNRGVPVRQLIADPIWLQIVHSTNLLNRWDINSVIQPIDKLKDNFTIELDVTNYKQSPYIQQVVDFGYRFLIVNKNKLPCGLRIRRFCAIIFPWLSRAYLKFSLGLKELKSRRPQLSTDEARAICEHWTSEYENLKAL